MNKVCYVLGAGFSAYAGLPVMANFLDRAKDIYFSDANIECKSEIKRILDSIREYAILKEYMICDLTNIEELLSITDMKTYTSRRKDFRNIKSFIRGVILYYENCLFSKKLVDSSRLNFEILDNGILTKYLNFVCSLFQVKLTANTITPNSNSQIISDYGIINEIRTQYSIISFNYDTILENIVKIINDKCSKGAISFNRGKGEGLRYCKLHGSIDSDTIIPPTWAKTLQSEIKQDWVDAYESIKNANEVRIIGFSFPNTDSHISYLFKSAIINNDNLKKIDVICLDNKDCSLQMKYDSIFCTKKYHFFNENVSKYLGYLGPNVASNFARYSTLEDVHKSYYSQAF
jgi:hypothetical protein